MARLGMSAWLVIATAALALWVGVSGRFGADASLADTRGSMVVLALVAASYVGGWLLSDQAGLVAPLMGTGIIATVMATGGLMDTSPLAPPLGYANANAALAVAATALLLAGVNRCPPALATTFWVLASLTTVWTLFIGSAAGAVGCVLVLLAASLQARLSARRAAVTAAILIASGIAVSALLSLVQPETVAKALSATRMRLWSEALTTIGEHPLFGLGPGSFVDQNVTGGDADTVSAHSLWWETGAELGIPGLLLALACTGLVLARLARSSSSTAVVGCALIAAFGLQASIDYVADFTVLVAVVSLSAGLLASRDGDEVLGTVDDATRVHGRQESRQGARRARHLPAPDANQTGARVGPRPAGGP